MWSTRQLDQQISTLYYDRLLASHDKEIVITEAEEKLQKVIPEGFIKYRMFDALTKQTFASKYKLTLPTEEELQTELNRARKRMEEKRKKLKPSRLIIKTILSSEL